MWERNIREIKAKEKAFIEADLKEEQEKTDKSIIIHVKKVREKMNKITSLIEEEDIKSEIKEALVIERSNALSEYISRVERNNNEKEKMKEKEKEEKEKESKISTDQKVKKLEEIVVELTKQNKSMGNNRPYNRFNNRFGNNYRNGNNNNRIPRQNDPRDVRYRGNRFNGNNGMNNRYNNINRYNNGYDNRNNNGRYNNR